MTTCSFSHLHPSVRPAALGTLWSWEEISSSTKLTSVFSHAERLFAGAQTWCWSRMCHPEPSEALFFLIRFITNTELFNVWSLEPTRLPAAPCRVPVVRETRDAERGRRSSGLCRIPSGEEKCPTGQWLEVPVQSRPWTGCDLGLRCRWSRERVCPTDPAPGWVSGFYFSSLDAGWTWSVCVSRWVFEAPVMG